VFPNKETGRQVEHVDGNIDPIRDLETISRELLLKDAALLESSIARATKMVKNTSDPRKLATLTALKKAKELVNSGVDVREGVWTDLEADVLVEAGLLTSKPIVYLLNASVEQFLTRYDDKLEEVRAWIHKRSPGSVSILFSADLEADLKLMEPEERESYISELVSETPLHPKAAPLVDFGGRESSYLQASAVEHAEKTLSMVPAITTSAYTALELIQYFTAGPDEVRAWTIRKDSTAPQAAGVIHSDIEKNFNSAEVFSVSDYIDTATSLSAGPGDWKAIEEALKKQARIKTQGRAYVVQDGDVMLFKHSAKK
jgi:obg-like ATPase 1